VVRFAPYTVLLNTAVVAKLSEHLGARPCEHSDSHRGHANGFIG
jgi:hypothetical protein